MVAGWGDWLGTYHGSLGTFGTSWALQSKTRSVSDQSWHGGVGRQQPPTSTGRETGSPGARTSEGEQASGLGEGGMWDGQHVGGTHRKARGASRADGSSSTRDPLHDRRRAETGVRKLRQPHSHLPQHPAGLPDPPQVVPCPLLLQSPPVWTPPHHNPVLIPPQAPPFCRPPHSQFLLSALWSPGGQGDLGLPSPPAPLGVRSGR